MAQSLNNGLAVSLHFNAAFIGHILKQNQSKYDDINSIFFKLCYQLLNDVVFVCMSVCVLGGGGGGGGGGEAHHSIRK